MPLAVGDRFGPYEILAPIGAGGMGEVYRARDTRLKREVAVKVLPDAFAGDPERMARFQREAQVLASLNHPNIATIYGVEERALAMELVEGETLASRVPIQTALEYARQIAEALEYAHERGVIHRDLKPANVKVTPEGTVKLLDFGLAKAIEEPRGSTEDPANSPTLTLGASRVGVIMGTAAYMSPEQASGKPADRRADIWSFGAVLYEMLTGKPAFAGESVSDTLASVLKLDPDWSALPDSAPASIKKLVRRCLTKDRKRRLQAIGEARIAIEEAQTGVPLDETVTPTGVTRRSITPWVAAGVLAVVAALASWAALRASRPVERPLMRLNVELAPDIALARVLGRMALSPDGMQLVACIRGMDGQVRLGIRRLDQNQVNLLSGTEGASFPFFSPNGRWIAFSAGGFLKKIAVEGGAPITLGIRSMGGSWGGDGNIIGVLGVAAGLSRVPSDGGPATAVTQINRGKGELAHRWPQVLPGSQAVLFTVHDNSGINDESDIDVISLKTGERKTVYHGGFFGRYLPSGHLVFIHQNTLFAAPFDLKRLALTGAPQPVVEDIRNEPDGGGEFDFSETGTFAYLSGKAELQRSIFWLDSSGHTQPLQPAPGLYSFPRFSPDGKRLAFALEDGQGHSDIWVRDLERDTTSRLTSLPGQNQWPVWTPDGRNIVFLAANSTAPGIYWIRADGSGAAYRVTDDNLRHVPQSITPDGKRLATLEPGTGSGVSIWTAAIEGDADHPRLGKRSVFLESQFVTVLPAFSSDGRWVAYQSNEPGRTGVWVRPFPGPGGEWQIESTAAYPIWSRNGHDLFFLVGGRIMAAGYTATGDSFLAGKPRLWSEKPVLVLGSPPTYMYDVGPDGKRFAVVLYPDGTTDEKPITHVTFLLNFFDELRRRVPAAK
jgi:Tol biopolymer transport system component/predicted Ser/Thr protein kinase